MGEDRDAESTGDESRRRFLRAMGATSALASVGGLANAQETATAAGQQTTTAAAEATPIVLGGRVPYWLGLAPAAIEGQQNPTLRLQAGEQYRLVWLNVDGERHQWRIDDGDGNALVRTEPVSRVGATQSVTFEATEAMAQYRCEFHPEQMQGGVELGTGFETTAEGEETTVADGQVVDVAVGPEGNTLRFVPEEVEISVGDTIRWTAKSPGHNVSFKPDADPKVELPEGAEPFASYEGNRSFAIMEVGETFEHTFTVPGTFVYVCVPHADQGMIGRVVVTE